MPQKIVHIITRLIRGGADENTIYTCNGQTALGHDVTLIVGRDYHESMTAQLSSKVNLIIIPELIRDISPYHDLKALLKLHRTLRRINPDIVHTHESKAGIIGRLAAATSGVKYIVHGVHILAFENTNTFNKYIYILLERAAAFTTDLYINVSPGVMKSCLNNKIGDIARHIVVPSGMDVHKYKNTNFTDWRHLHDALRRLTEKPPIILISGALEPRKRTIEFVMQFSNLRSHMANAVLLIAGDGPDRERISRYINVNNLQESVLLLGHREDLQNVIAVADVCCHAATREGLPRVIVQYALAKKPIVTTNLPGIDQIVQDGVTGHIVTSVEEMTQHVMRLLKSEDERILIAQNYDITHLDAWSIESMVEKIETGYRRLIEKHDESSEKKTIEVKTC